MHLWIKIKCGFFDSWESILNNLNLSFGKKKNRTFVQRFKADVTLWLQSQDDRNTSHRLAKWATKYIVKTDRQDDWPVAPSDTALQFFVYLHMLSLTNHIRNHVNMLMTFLKHTICMAPELPALPTDCLCVCLCLIFVFVFVLINANFTKKWLMCTFTTSTVTCRSFWFRFSSHRAFSGYKINTNFISKYREKNQR